VTGSVALVGAGPGDPDLLTLGALKALQGADVILHDDLVSPAVLAFARREARTLLVGKRGGQPSASQRDIEALMVKLARQGRNVVRLKGGDPMLFGRADEEIAACRAAGVPVRIVPGVTALSAAAAALGCSLTSRDGARKVEITTGHDHTGHLPDEPGTARTTQAVYMAKATAAAHAGRLIAAGQDPDTPVAFIVAASRPDEAVLRGTLATVADLVAALPSDAPALLVIGPAARDEAADGRARACSVG
jgi:uroporphyrin-III C-methyltransferase / precorrin-2 dehydrogenase / sirohydrochlorin ferrochelatase